MTLIRGKRGCRQEGFGPCRVVHQGARQEFGPDSTQLLLQFAIANPDHAPYGKRAHEALEHAGVWMAMAPKLVRGENIAQTAQFIDSGAADAGIVALSLVLSPQLRDRGTWTLIPDDWHAPLEQGYVITRRAADSPLAAAFADWIDSPAARVVLRRHGFALPGEAAQ